VLRFSWVRTSLKEVTVVLGVNWSITNKQIIFIRTSDRRGSSLFSFHNFFSEYSLVVNSDSAKNMEEVLDRAIYFGI
jgi:hypothetical protein